MAHINQRYRTSFKKYVSALLLVIPLLLLFHGQARAEAGEPEDKIMEEQLKSGEVKKIEDQMNKYASGSLREVIPGYDPQKILRGISEGKFEFSLKGILNRALAYLFKEIYLNIHLLIKLVVLILLCAVLKNLQTSFLSEGVGELAFYVCYVVIVSVLLVSFHTAMELAKDIIDSMVAFMHATVPVLITLMVSGGNMASAGIFQPLLIMIVEITATVMRNVFIPLIFLASILSIVDNISDKVQISRLAGFIRQISGWAMGLILTLMIAVVSVQGSLGAVVDGVTSKTVKFAIGTFIPVAGKILADAADAVIGCTLLVKNAAGVAVMIGIIGMSLIPLLKLFALMLLYRMTCILVEPISEKRITNCVNEIANSMTFIIGIVASVTFMFLISITAIISASNISAMIR